MGSTFSPGRGKFLSRLSGWRELGDLSDWRESACLDTPIAPNDCRSSGSLRTDIEVGQYLGAET
jgi:hypothetical protein